MTARDYEAEARDMLTKTTECKSDQGATLALRMSHTLATLEVAKQVRRIADAMERGEQVGAGRSGQPSRGTSPANEAGSLPRAKAGAPDTASGGDVPPRSGILPPLDVELIERAHLMLKDLLDYPGLRFHVGNLLARRAEACLAELRRWKEQQL